MGGCFVFFLNRLKTKLTLEKSGNANVKYQYFSWKRFLYIM